MDRKLKESGISPGHYGCIMEINESPGITQEHLGAILRVDKANISRVIHRLAELKMIKIEAASGDKRRQNLFLTDKGKKTIPSIRKALADWSRAISKNITGKEFNSIVRTLEIMASNAERVVE